ncbi:thiamine phosphate synthase [Brevibacillus sp. H7]|uniref:thiamine phosphate synthase n=1 Tax=Brevibacillus sp. H7 TaxID=3349138 RepID=UPI00381F6FAF
MKNRDLLREKLCVYLVIGTQDCGHSVERTVSVVREALAGGIGTVQLRDKGSKLTKEERYSLALRLLQLCRENDALFFINDDVELAVRVQADGIHVGQDDMPLAQVQQLVGPDMYIGISAGTPEEAMAALSGGADYLGVGAMYVTASKADAGEPIGPAGLAEIRQAVGAELPIVGIGGITAGNCSPVIAAGADGVAVISAISRAKSPRHAAQQLAEAVRRTRQC